MRSLLKNALAIIQITILVGGGLIAWGRMTARLDAIEKQNDERHKEVMDELSRQGQRILAVEGEIFRATINTDHSPTTHPKYTP